MGSETILPPPGLTEHPNPDVFHNGVYPIYPLLTKCKAVDPGMQYLEEFLKKHCLQKYTRYLTHLSVDAFMALNNAQLIACNIPLSARSNFLKQIDILHERPYFLRRLSIKIENDQSKLLEVVTELRDCMLSPLTSYWPCGKELHDHMHGTNPFTNIFHINEQNLPGLIMSVASRCHHVVITNDYPLSLAIYDTLLSLYGIMYTHIAFTSYQKQCLYRRMGVIKVRRDWANLYIASQQNPSGWPPEQFILENIFKVIAWNRNVIAACCFGTLNLYEDYKDLFRRNRQFGRPTPIPEPEPYVITPLQPIHLISSPVPAFDYVWEMAPVNAPFNQTFSNDNGYEMLPNDDDEVFLPSSPFPNSGIPKFPCPEEEDGSLARNLPSHHHYINLHSYHQ